MRRSFAGVRPRLVGAALAVLVCAAVSARALVAQAPPASAYSLQQVMSYPFPADLVASPAGDRIAWTFLSKGIRSLWVAEGPGFQARELVTTPEEDGQELTSLTFSGDGTRIVYVRGGDHGANWTGDGGLVPNPTSSPVQPRQQVWSVPVDGGAPAPSPTGDRVAFEQNGAIWVAPGDGSKPAARMFFARGRSGSPVWSPDGNTLAFISSRGSLGYIALYAGPDRPLRYLAPSTSQDDMPRWSPDGTRIAFVRRAGRGIGAQPPLEVRPQPWALWVADVKSGEGRELWRSPETLPGSYPRTLGEANLAWGAGDRLVFLSYQDGWPHLYSIPASAGPAAAGGASAASTTASTTTASTTTGGATTGSATTGNAKPAANAQALLLTPGSFMVEYVTLTPDRRFAIYNANAGTDKDDIERRHLFKVPVDAATPVALTSGTGIEWQPVVTAGGRTLAYFAATAQKPPLPYVRALDAPAGPGVTNGSARTGAGASGSAGGGTADAAGGVRAIAEDRIPADFPAAQMVTPEHVIYKAPDGGAVHGQLFKPRAGGEARKPAIIFVHGGPPRQMLLGWHYRFYYANSYAVNQYLASRGFVVLSVNYRLGIGYGYDFHNPRDGGTRGAGEYQDVLAGGKYLQGRPDVDPKRIGIWGGSYGGYLTALALGRNSDVFAAGVDIHGVHHRVNLPSEGQETAASVGDGVTPAQLQEAARVAWTASPVSSIPTWKSPVLLIHGDDDRNVRVEQTVDLARRLKTAGIPFEEIIIPDDIHDFLLYRNWLRVNTATADYFEKHLKAAKPAPAGTGSR